MAIEQFGESLLTQKRQRDEEQASKLRKREERNALLGLAGTVGIGLYKQNLKEKQKDFFRNEKVLQAQVDSRLGASSAQQGTTDWEKSQVYAGGARQYVTDTYITPLMQQRFVEAGENKFKNERDLALAIREASNNFASEKDEDGLTVYDKWQQWTDVSRGIDTSVDSKTFLKNNNNLPRSAASAFYQRYLSKSNTDPYEQAVTDFQNSDYVTTRQEALNLRRLFTEGLGLTKSAEAAKKIQSFYDEVPDKKDTVEDYEYQVPTADGTGVAKFMGTKRTSARGVVSYWGADGKKLNMGQSVAKSEVKSVTRTGEKVTSTTYTIIDNATRQPIDSVDGPARITGTEEPATAPLDPNMIRQATQAISRTIENPTHSISVPFFGDKEVTQQPAGDLFEKYITQNTSGDVDLSETRQKGFTNRVGVSASYLLEDNKVDGDIAYDLASAIEFNELGRQFEGSDYVPSNSFYRDIDDEPTPLQILEGVATLQGTPSEVSPEDLPSILQIVFKDRGASLAAEIKSLQNEKGKSSQLENLFTRNEKFQSLLKSPAMLKALGYPETLNGKPNTIIFDTYNSQVRLGEKEPRQEDSDSLDDEASANLAASVEEDLKAPQTSELDLFAQNQMALLEEKYKPSPTTSQGPRAAAEAMDAKTRARRQLRNDGMYQIISRYDSLKDAGATGSNETISQLEQALADTVSDRGNTLEVNQLRTKLNNEKAMRDIKEQLAQLMQ
jgi:hypothetical protein